MELIFQEESFIVKTLSAPEELDAALRLRHEIFREELRWVPPSPDGLDLDRFDDFAHPIGVFNDMGEMIGHVRLINAPDPFMIEDDFSELLPADGSFRKTPGMAESTRICVRKDYRTARVCGMTMAHLLYKAIYRWSRVMDGADSMVTIIEQNYYLYLKRFYPFRPLADFAPLGDGVMSGIVLLDWNELEEKLRARRPGFFNWLNELQPLVPSRRLPRALY